MVLRGRRPLRLRHRWLARSEEGRPLGGAGAGPPGRADLGRGLRYDWGWIRTGRDAPGVRTVKRTLPNVMLSLLFLDACKTPHGFDSKNDEFDAVAPRPTRHNPARRMRMSMTLKDRNWQPSEAPHPWPPGRARVRPNLCGLAIATLVLAAPAPLAAQGQLDTLRIDSLMSVAADRVRSAAIAAAREDADVVLDARTDLFGYGGVFGEVLGELAAAGCEQARRWVTDTAEELFWLSSSLTLAAERSADGEMEQWPIGPEVILDELEALQEIWVGIKDENRDMCARPADVVVRDSRTNSESGLVRRRRGPPANPLPRRVRPNGNDHPPRR